jgi:hypothetical protein
MPPGSSLFAYVLPAQAVSSLPDLLGHPSLKDIYLTLLIMVACFVVLYCDAYLRYTQFSESEFPAYLVLGNWASGIVHSRKLSRHKNWGRGC